MGKEQNEQPKGAENDDTGAGPSNVLVVPGIPKKKLEDKEFLDTLKERFESFGDLERWTPFKGLGRIRIVYRTTESAVLARKLMNGEKWEGTTLKIYYLPFEPIACPEDVPEFEPSNRHLDVPQLDKLHLLSPPASPPVGWERRVEDVPVIDQALVSRLAGLKANEETEIHKGDSTKGYPSIVVLACEDMSPDPMAQRAAIRHRQQLAAALGGGRGLLPDEPCGPGAKMTVQKSRTPRPPMKDVHRTALCL
eukprot:comp22348_c1_seq1/m.33257 comp22348_c1_seq1/g.33257  ORF comp22348_c1_seq1/g.33257 comp22348_c1_seq1/m.33257 type:complete len:251 (-) comp22348_c1_seq1:289-1041(-)